MVWSTVKFCSPLTDFQPVLFIYMLGHNFHFCYQTSYDTEYYVYVGRKVSLVILIQRFCIFMGTITEFLQGCHVQK